MNIMILFNPIAGAGRAAAAGRELSDVLRKAGHEVVVTPTKMEPTAAWLDQSLKGIELLIVAGGDGAVRLASASAARTHTPLYHFPFGTENLFAREFGMDRTEATLLRAIERREVCRVDMGIANGRSFLLMASLGFDAEVVHHLAGKRGKSISHFSYLPPIMKELLRWKPPELEVFVDGDRINKDEPGFVVVANCKHYGWRLNPAGRASMTDGILDVTFFPTRSRLVLFGWAMRCRRQNHLNHPRLVYRMGKSVKITSRMSQNYQLDGDPPGKLLDHGTEKESMTDGFSLSIEIRPGVLPVMVP